MHLRTVKGQSTLELCIMLSVVILAIVAMQSYVKFAVAGRAKSSADSISQTLFNPDDSRTELSSTRTSTDETITNATDRLGTGGAGQNVSTTAAGVGADVSTRRDYLN